MDTQGPEDVDPADQWVLDPVTGEYQLRTDPLPPAAQARPASAQAPWSAEPAPWSATPASGSAEPAPWSAEPEPAPGSAAPVSPSASPSTPVPAPASAPAGTGGSGGSGGRRAPGGRGAPGGHGGRRVAGRSSRRKPKARASGGRRAAMWSAGVLGLALVASAVGVAVAQRHSGGAGVHTVDVGDAAAASLSTRGPLNVLLISSAERSGSTGAGLAGSDASGPGGAAQESGGEADSAVLLHLSADRRSATALTIPGDLVTAIPDCPAGGKSGSATVVPGTPVKGASPTFRQSLGTGGRDAGCTMRVVDRLTGVKADHFVLADARAIRALTTAAGGVPVCLKDPLSDPAAHLDLAAGQHRLTAGQAPGFLTTRAAPPGRTDADRASLQQAFLGALLRQSRSGGPAVSKALAAASARTLTVDPALGSTSALATLAGELAKVDLAHVTFAAVPVTAGSGGTAGSDGSGSGGPAVTLDAAAARQLFSLVARDIPLSAGRAAPDPRLIGPKATPHNTRVTVLNGTGAFGASQDVLLWLQNDEGANRSANGGDAPATLATTRLDYAPNQADQARSLAAMMGLPASALHEGTKDVPPLTYMTLTLGKDYTAPGTPIALPTVPPKGLRTATADSAACVG